VWFSQSAEHALPICDEALGLAQQMGDADAACGTSINRVNMLSGLRRVQEARVELERARSLLPKAGPARTVMFEMTAGILEFYAMRRQDALNHYTRALKMAREFGMHAEVARALVNLASLDLPGVTPRVALERQAEATRIASECGDMRLALYALQGEAEALARIRDYETAAQRLQTARWYAETLGQASQAELARLGRATMLLSIPGYHGALAECLQSLQDCSPRNETALGWISTASAVAVYYQQVQDPNNARAWAARAFELCANFPGIWQDAQALLAPLRDLQPAGFQPPVMA
jgi:tetratricopeptide (TPR) repeat protein